MRRLRSRSILALAPIAGLAFGSGCTSVQVVSESGALGLPRPDLVLVYDFATSPDEVELDSGLSAEVVEALKSAPRSEQERELGAKVANDMAEHIVEGINKLGLAAVRAHGPIPFQGSQLLIKGQLISIDQGNRTERVVIGLGLGRSDVETHVQVFLDRAGDDQDIEQLDIAAKGSRKPGAAETLGVGALAGDLVVSGAVTVAGTVASETFGGTVEADARRTAGKVVDELKTFFDRQGWIDAD